LSVGISRNEIVRITLERYITTVAETAGISLDPLPKVAPLERLTISSDAECAIADEYVKLAVRVACNQVCGKTFEGNKPCIRGDRKVKAVVIPLGSTRCEADTFSESKQPVAHKNVRRSVRVSGTRLFARTIEPDKASVGSDGDSVCPENPFP
jgi:hypothetical protein